MRDEAPGSVAYVDRRGRQIEGTYPRDVGAEIITGKRIVFGWGQINDNMWPHARYDGPEPPGLDVLAKHRRAVAAFAWTTLTISNAQSQPDAHL